MPALPTLLNGQSYVFTNAPFSVDATPTSSVYTSGPMGGSLPPPDITGYTYGDYAVPNYNVAAGAPVPNLVTQMPNPTNPAAPIQHPSWLPWILLGAVLGGVILFGHKHDKVKKGK